MMRHVFVFALIVLSLVAESWAQLRPPNEAGVSLGHWHALVRDVEARLARISRKGPRRSGRGIAPQGAGESH